MIVAVPGELDASPASKPNHTAKFAIYYCRGHGVIGWGGCDLRQGGDATCCTRGRYDYPCHKRDAASARASYILLQRQRLNRDEYGQSD